MKPAILLGICWLAVSVTGLGQVVRVQSVSSQTIRTTKGTRLDAELFRFLLATHEADGPANKRYMFKVPLLVSARHPGIGVYKFGTGAVHAGYRVVFQYRTKLIFSSALTAEPFLKLLPDFLAQYPTAFSLQAQRAAQTQLQTIVELNRMSGETDLPD